jgi:hypothetical protein
MKFSDWEITHIPPWRIKLLIEKWDMTMGTLIKAVIGGDKASDNREKIDIRTPMGSAAFAAWVNKEAQRGSDGR